MITLLLRRTEIDGDKIIRIQHGFEQVYKKILNKAKKSKDQILEVLDFCKKEFYDIEDREAKDIEVLARRMELNQ